MNNEKVLSTQVEVFHQQMIELIKKYQFRDRNQILSCGISVSQCYLLEVLHTQGELTVNEVAQKMYLSISTITRIVDQLVKKKYVSREESLNDRRVRVLKLTKDGEAVYQASWQNVFQSEKIILENFPPEHREMLIQFLKMLNQAVDNWQFFCKRE